MINLSHSTIFIRSVEAVTRSARHLCQRAKIPRAVLESDHVNYAEVFVGARKLRSLLVHEYMADANLFLDSLRATDGATQLLMDVVVNIARHAEAIGLNDYSPNKPKNDRFEGI